MEAEIGTLQNSEDIKRTLGAATQRLTESEQAIVGQLNELSNSLDSIKQYNPKVEVLHQRFESTIFELQDISSELETIGDATEYNPERIQEVQERLDLIYKLQKKHNVVDIAQLIEIQENLQNQLDSFGDLTAQIEQLEHDINQQEKHLYELAKDLSGKRQSVIKGFESKVHTMLAQLSMENARLKVDIQTLDTLHSTGIDEVNYLFAANKGGRLQAIKDVASGGEISRLTLCTKSLVASAIPLPTLIFDEIDTGISGDVALKMGNILRQLSDHHQVVSITHSPQIASKADTHYYVYKKDLAERTITKVKALSTDERIRAIATMLSSNPPSDSAMENARELVESA